MKAALLALVLASALAAAPRLGQLPPTGPSGVGSIEVIVKRSGGAPLDDVDVTLTGAPGAGTATAQTGSDGRAVFRNLSAGKYQVRAEMLGYLAMSSDGTVAVQASVSIDLGNRAVQQVRLALTQGSVLTGRVKDQKGRPVLGMRVRALRMMYQYNQRVLAAAPYQSDPWTNDLGEFRIFWLPPGEYTILAEGPDTVASPIVYRRSIYYPGTADLNLAGRVMLKEGQEARADFVLPPTSAATISGTVTGSGLDEESLHYTFSLTPTPFVPFEQPVYYVHYGSGFEIGGVPPGSYELFALLRGTGSEQVTGRTKVDVGSADVRGVAITLERGSNVRGRFSIAADVRTYLESRPQGPTGPRLSMSFSSLEPRTLLNTLGSGVIGGRTGEEGQPDLVFSISNMIRSRYQLISVSPLPTDAYVSDFWQDGKNVYNDGVIDVGKEPVNLEVAVSGNGGVVQGSVFMPTQGDGPGGLSVILIPDKPRRGNVLLYKRVEVTPNMDASVPFTFRGVAPGSYKVFACDFLLRGDEMNPDFLAQYDGRGVAVNLAAGAAVGGIQPPLIRTTR